MFSDLRGFTSFGEQRSSRSQVIEVLNRYLTRMSAAILDEGGTLVAYMGDGIMAVFGAPVHGRRARRRRADAPPGEMLAELRCVQRRATSPRGSATDFRMGIGPQQRPRDEAATSGPSDDSSTPRWATRRTPLLG